MNNLTYMVKAQKTDGTVGKEEKLLNAALGLAGEDGEFAYHIKKNRFQGHDLDPDHLVKELGDILWYIAQAATALDVPIDEIMDRNIKKLEARYPEGHFDADRSRNREPEKDNPPTGGSSIQSAAKGLQAAADKIKKAFTAPTIEPMIMPMFDFKPVPGPCQLLVEILKDERVAAEVRLEYYPKLVEARSWPAGIITMKEGRP
jgi:NTP pyrophosphatase (non-canonical NTP hydrolase)